MKKLLGLLALLALPVCADDVARLHALFDRTWELNLREDPLFATSVGRHDYNDRLPAIAPADLERQYEFAQQALAELASIDRAKLPAFEAVNYDEFKRQLEVGIGNYELGDYQLPFNADSGFHSSFSRLPQDVKSRLSVVPVSEDEARGAIGAILE